MDLLDSVLRRHEELVYDKLNDGVNKLNFLDVSTLKQMLQDTIETDDVNVLQGILNTLKAKSKEISASLKKFKEDEKQAKTSNNDTSNVMDNTQNNRRPRRKAFEDASERVNNQITQTLKSKLRRDDIIVKIERISAIPKNPQQSENEQQEDMQPPAAVSKRARGKKKSVTAIKVEKPERRSTRSKRSKAIPEKHEKEEQVKGSFSDVVLIEEPVHVIVLDDEQTVSNLEEAEEGLQEADAPKHSVVEKAPAKKSKHATGSSGTLSKRQKGKNFKIERHSKTSADEDALGASVEDLTTPKIKISHGNQEVVIQLPTVFLDPLPKKVTGGVGASNEVVLIQTYVNPNTTVVIEEPRVVYSSQEENVNDIITDDESDLDNPPIVSEQNIVKEVANSFKKTPLKKKVEAREKLGSRDPGESSQTKTKSMANKSTDNFGAVAKVLKGTPALMKPTFLTTGNFSEGTKKAPSASKLTSQRHRIFVEAAKEKKDEALLKKEVLLKKQTEEKRRKREEKEAKAKLQREEKEKERLRFVELQKEKDEMYYKRMQQQTERAQKQREDVEKRRLQTKARYEEIKREEERKRLEEIQKLKDEEQCAGEVQDYRLQKQQHTEENSRSPLPIYLRQEAPPLPTPDCYDSDDANGHVKKCDLPAWNLPEPMQCFLHTMSYLRYNSYVENTLFCLKPQTPDLQEIFPNVDPRKLRRSSSAIWKASPRFTMMPQMNDDQV